MPIRFFQLNPAHYFILAILLFIAFYLGLAAYPLFNNNEGLYAEVAREMLVTGNYIIPQLNFVPYIEKPPLLYWLIAGSYHIFGVTVFAVRLIPTTSAVITILCLVWFGHQVKRPLAAWLAAIMLTTSLGFIAIGRIVFFDMLLTACFTLTLCAFFIWWRTYQQRYLWVAYLFLALGVLCKGMLMLILIPAIQIIFLICCGEKKRILALFNPAGITLFLLIAAPWHVIAGLQQPGFLWDYGINEQVLRFLNERQPHDYYQGPIYYYIPRILIYIFPWSLFVPLLFKKAFKTADNNADKLPLFLWLWLLIPLIFFSLSQAKANYYLIISMPAFVFLLALKLQESLIKKEYSIFVFVFAFLSILFTVILFYFSIIKPHVNALIYQLYDLFNPWLYGLLMFTIVFFLLSGIFYLLNKLDIRSGSLFLENLKNGDGVLLLSGICGISLIVLILAYRILLVIPEQYNELNIVHYLKAQPTVKPVYFYENYGKQSTLLFYLKKRIPIIDSRDADLAYGEKTAAAHEWFIKGKEFETIAKKQLCYVALVEENLADFNQAISGIQFCPVASNGRGLLLSNDPQDCLKR